jgi:hypothetical protein
MTATFKFIEYSNATTTADITAGNLNFGSTNAASLNPTTWAIVAGERSYEKIIRANFSGTFTWIGNLQLWKSAGVYKTEEVLKVSATTTGTYSPSDWIANPTTDASTYATHTAATSDPGTPNIGIGGILVETQGDGGLTSAGNSDYILFQLLTSSDTESGATNTKTITLQYDEIS